MAKKRRSRRKPSRDPRPTYVGGYSPKRRVNLADLPKDMFRPKTTDELVNGSHS
ncbi:MAG: hypothetical protein OXM54_01765 [Acidimicrobiaceae bacterium]|nr:hypothetical protein [Acidimicrobiaceae bacterium]